MLALKALLWAAMVAAITTKVTFEKDLNMDAVFPGPVFRPDPNVPEGHMRPLGWQRKTDGPVEEVEGAVSPIEFYNQYVSKDLPVTMREALPRSAPVFDNWKDDSYLLKQYSNVNVSVRVKTGRRRGRVQTASQGMTMKKFIAEYKYEEWYLSSVIPINMMEEIPLPSCVRCGTISEHLWSAQLWMSSGGTSSRVHSHDDHLLHCVLFGRRDFILIEGYHKKAFDFQPDFSGSLGGHSDMNTEMVDTLQYPQIARVPWVWSTLMPGDCIFVPAGWIHQVRSHGRSVSVTIEFSPLKDFDDTGCTLDDEEFAPLSLASFQFLMEDGQLGFSNKNLEADDVLNLLVGLIGKSEALDYYRFNHFYSGLVENIKTAPTAREVFDYLAPKRHMMSLPQSTIFEIHPKDLSKIAEVFNKIYKKKDSDNTLRKQKSKDEF